MAKKDNNILIVAVVAIAAIIAIVYLSGGLRSSVLIGSEQAGKAISAGGTYVCKYEIRENRQNGPVVVDGGETTVTASNADEAWNKCYEIIKKSRSIEGGGSGYYNRPYIVITKVLVEF